MKRLTLSFFLVLLSVGCIFAQDMSKPPAPVQNEVFDAMIGTWTGESEMMGMKMTETLNFSWDMNHQYVIMKLSGVGSDDPSMTYSGMAIMGVNDAGASKTWWFDDWGMDRTMQGTGTFSGMTYRMYGKNDAYTDDRTISWNDQGQMVMTWKGDVHVPGFEMSMNGVTVYTKQ